MLTRVETGWQCDTIEIILYQKIGSFTKYERFFL